MPQRRNPVSREAPGLLGQSWLKIVGEEPVVVGNVGIPLRFFGRPLPVETASVTPLKIVPYISIAFSHSSTKA